MIPFDQNLFPFLYLQKEKFYILFCPLYIQSLVPNKNPIHEGF